MALMASLSFGTAAPNCVYSLATVYAVWIAVVLAMYSLCV